MADKNARSEPCVIGIDIGGTKCLGVVIDQRGKIIVRQKRPTHQGAAAVTRSLAALARDLIAEAGPNNDVRGVGIGIAGLVDSIGRLRRAPNLVDADEFAVRDLVEPEIGLPVVVDNDANCAARAELAVGVAQGVRHAVLVTLGTGIGGALIADGAVVRGSNGMAGEPGHMMVDPSGPLCVCGLRGCWERYASGAGLVHLARLAADRGELGGVLSSTGSLEALRGEHVTRAARLGDDEAAAVLDTFSWWIAVGIANCAALSDPELIIVGGGLVRDWDLLADRVNGYLAQVLVGARHRPRLRVEPASAGEAAGALGAAMLAATETGVHP